MKKDLEKEVKRLVDLNCKEKGYVCAVDILLQLDCLTKKDYEDWRFGWVEYLEKVCKINLSQLSQFYKLLQKCVIDLSLKASWTGYNQYGKGIKRRLRFSKSGNKFIEESYGLHYIDIRRINELKGKKGIMYQGNCKSPDGEV